MKIEWKSLFIYSIIIICGLIASLRFVPFNFSVQEVKVSYTETISAIGNIGDDGKKNPSGKKGKGKR